VMVGQDEYTRLALVLEPVFASKIFGGLSTTIFNQIDEAIGDVTGVEPETSISGLLDEEERENTISTVEALLDIILNNDLSDMTLEQYGQILDVLKINAKGDTTGETPVRGTFNDVFANIVWYMTNDSIDGIDRQTTTNANYQDVKKYLAVDTSENYYGYYDVNYAEKLAELDDVMDFATELMTAVAGKSLSSDIEIAQYLQAAKAVVDARVTAETTETEGATLEVINNMAKLEKDLLGEQSTETQYKVKAGIETLYEDDADMKDALLKLFKLDTLPALPV